MGAGLPLAAESTELSFCPLLLAPLKINEETMIV